MKKLLLAFALCFSLASLPALAATANASFAPTGEARLTVGSVSANVLFPTAGTPTLARVTNLGVTSAAILMGTSSAVTATLATGLVLLPSQTIYLTIGSNTYLAAIAASGNTVVSIDMGN